MFHNIEKCYLGEAMVDMWLLLCSGYSSLAPILIWSFSAFMLVKSLSRCSFLNGSFFLSCISSLTVSSFSEWSIIDCVLTWHWYKLNACLASEFLSAFVTKPLKIFFRLFSAILCCLLWFSSRSSLLICLIPSMYCLSSSLMSYSMLITNLNIYSHRQNVSFPELFLL